MDSKTIRICKTCNMGYILPYGGHEVCEGCLGHEHRRSVFVGIVDSAKPTLPPPLLNGPTTSPPASPLRTERPGAAALPVSAATSLPVVGALVAELPGIIAREAANHGLAVPLPQAPRCPDQLHGIWGLEAATRPARLDPIWPMFPCTSAGLRRSPGGSMPR